MFQQTLEQVVRSTWQSEPVKTQVSQQGSCWSMVQEDINKTLSQEKKGKAFQSCVTNTGVSWAEPQQTDKGNGGFPSGTDSKKSYW